MAGASRYSLPQEGVPAGARALPSATPAGGP